MTIESVKERMAELKVKIKKGNYACEQAWENNFTLLKILEYEKEYGRDYYTGKPLNNVEKEVNANG